MRCHGKQITARVYTYVRFMDDVAVSGNKTASTIHPYPINIIYCIVERFKDQKEVTRARVCMA